MLHDFGVISGLILVRVSDLTDCCELLSKLLFSFRKTSTFKCSSAREVRRWLQSFLPGKMHSDGADVADIARYLQARTAIFQLPFECICVLTSA